MKLYFINHSCLFAVEQMMMTLFPGERPVYPEEPPEPEDLAATVSVLYGMKEVTADTLLQKDGVMYRGRRQAPAAEFSDQLTSKRALQRIVRLSFYDAGVQALGQEPPWGALTGVRPVKLPTRVLWEGGTPEEAAAQLRELYHVSPRRVELAMACAQAALAVKRALRPDEVSLYVGIPFCPTRCAYCSFISADVKRSLALVEPYLDGLCAEIDAAGAALARTGRFVRTIYIGGGTPTTLSAAQLARLMEQRRNYLFHPGDTPVFAADGEEKYRLGAASPILSQGDLMGCVMLLMGEHDAAPTESEQTLAQTFAGFLGKQMES